MSTSSSRWFESKNWAPSPRRKAVSHAFEQHAPLYREPELHQKTDSRPLIAVTQMRACLLPSTVF